MIASSIIREKFLEKYKQVFDFYLQTPIDYIVFNREHNLINITWKDVVAYIDNCQFLKRQYSYMSAVGKPQISNRIQLLADFYKDKPTIGSYYPTMVLTKTTRILTKRFNRITKTINPNDTSNMLESSSGSSQIDQLVIHFQDQTLFLNSNSLSALERSLSKDNSIQEQSQMYEETHDIYQHNTSTQHNTQYKDYLLREDQLSLQHLICDYDDFDTHQTIKNYEKYKLRVQPKNDIKKPNLLTKISIQAVEEKKQYKVDKYNQEYHKNYSPKYNHLIYPYHQSEKLYSHQPHLTRQSLNTKFEQNDKILKQQLDKVEKKKHIRQKAVELLGINRIKEY